MTGAGGAGADAAALGADGAPAVHAAVAHAAFSEDSKEHRAALRRIATPAALRATDQSGATARVGNFGGVDTPDSDGATPLHLALANGNGVVAAALVDIGASTATAGHGGRVANAGHGGLLPLHVWALVPSLCRHAGLCDQLAGPGGGSPARFGTHYWEAIHIATAADDGTTPLHVAAKGANAGAVGPLLRLGADPLSVTRRRRTPLHLSAASGLPEQRSSWDKGRHVTSAEATWRYIFFSHDALPLCGRGGVLRAKGAIALLTEPRS
eukprot:gene52593-19474_t